MRKKTPFELTLLNVGSDENLMFITSDLHVTARLQDDMRKSKHYDLYIYDDQLTQMGQVVADLHPEHIHLRNRTLEATVTCPLVWVPGQYFLLMVYKDKEGMVSAWRADFLLDDQLHFCFLQMKACVGLSIDSTLATFYNEGSKSVWKRFTTIPGARQLKQKTLEFTQQEWVNQMRVAENESELPLDRHYVIKTPTMNYFHQTMAMLRCLVLKGYEYEHIECSKLYEPHNGVNPYEKLQQLFEHGDDENIFDQIRQACKKRFYCITDFHILCTPAGKPILQKLLPYILSKSQSPGVALVGSPQEIEALFEQNPSIRDRFNESTQITIEPYTRAETIRCFFERARVLGFSFSKTDKDYVGRLLSTAYIQGSIRHWRQRDMDRYLLDTVRTRLMSRMEEILSNHPADWCHASALVQRDDLDEGKLLYERTDYEETLRELNQMVGLDDVKKSISTLSHRMRFFLERRQMGLPTSGNLACHAIFTGNPGTGKTTVARLLGRIYHSLGLLSRGDVITVDRNRIIGRFIGDTEENMRHILQEAKGNVLFIDEAYTLYSHSDCNDFGKRAIEMLLPVLTQKEADILVILAGYEKEMDNLMSMNPGLVGRFPYKFKFCDYHADELMQMAEAIFRRDDYVLTDEARTELRRTIDETLSQRVAHFGNARWIEQYVSNGIISALADRIVSLGEAVSREHYRRIEVVDIQTAYEKFNHKTIELKPRRAVGFSA